MSPTTTSNNNQQPTNCPNLDDYCEQYTTDDHPIADLVFVLAEIARYDNAQELLNTWSKLLNENNRLAEEMTDDEMEALLAEQAELQDKIDASHAWDLDREEPSDEERLKEVIAKLLDDERLDGREFMGRISGMLSKRFDAEPMQVNPDAYQGAVTPALTPAGKREIVAKAVSLSSLAALVKGLPDG